VGANAAGGMVFHLSCVGSGLCDGLIALAGDSYRLSVSNCVCDLYAVTLRRPRAKLGCCTLGKGNKCGVFRLYMDVRFQLSE
jgi:hypothetical protein